MGGASAGLWTRPRRSWQPSGSTAGPGAVTIRRVRSSPMPARPLTVLFMPESAYGPTNNCIGVGDVLRRRGHRVVFAAEASWRGRLDPLGFTEDLVDLAPPQAGAASQDAGQFWKDFIRDTAPEFRN